MSLIEVLVGILLISFGLLGLISMMSRNIQFSVGAEDANRAALLADEMASTILLTRNALPGAIVVPDLTTWRTEVGNAAGRGLPNGTGTVTPVGRTAQITIQWRAPQAAASSVYSTTVVLP